MLDTTILKIEHSKEDNAKKLLPYIQKCNVYAPEAAFVTLEWAEKDEKDWEDFLGSGKSRTHLAKALRERYADFPQDDTAFTIKEYDYLFQNQRLIWNLERFSQEEGRYIEEELEQIKDDHEEAFLLLLDFRDMQRYLQKSYLSYGRAGLLQRMRDKEIARNLEHGEKQIKLRYPSLSDKDPLQLVLAIGANHSPEEFYPNATVIIQAQGSSLSLRSIWAAYQRGDPVEAVATNILREDLRQDYVIQKEIEAHLNELNMD